MFRQKGLSLVELMIAITLGLILISGVVKVFLSSKATYSTQQALSRVQETGRLAMEFISRDVRMAGYNGCGSRTAGMSVTNTLNNASSFVWDFGQPIKGYTSAPTGATALPTGHGLLPVPYYVASPLFTTDVLTIRGSQGTGIEITQNNNSAQVFVSQVGSPVTVNGACADGSNKVSGLCQGDVVMVTDCTKARVFQITNVTASGSTEVNVVHSGNASGGTFNPGNNLSSWGGNSAPSSEIFGAGSELVTATSLTYYIGLGTSGRPSLFQNLNGVNSELLEGVENMRVLYGEDTTTDEDFIPDIYSTAAAVTNWNRINSVRIELLVASVEDRVLSDHQTYTFDGTATTATDYRLRQVFSSTIAVRNQLF
jgi:type IV pilus assembly protein PilW